MSKAYGMASWRIGYMVIPASLHEAVNKVQDTLLICPPAVSQHAALAALAVGRAHAAAHLARLDETRRLIFDTLNAADVPCDVAARRRRVLLPRARAFAAGFDDPGRTADSGASRRGDPRVGVRRRRALLDPHLIRRPRCRDRRRRASAGW